MTTFALVDCNNFYASCERLFRPDLLNRPIVVLSNNDGNVVARSQEAKDLGIPMGAPFFEWRNFFKGHAVHVCSTNPEFYTDMSKRVMDVIASFTPDIEIYSIDEAFVRLDGFGKLDLEPYCKEIRETIKKWTGITVSVGIAPTKTLAKIANHYAKRRFDGVFSLLDPGNLRDTLKNYPIEDIWGIGKQLSLKLQQISINTAQQLRDSDPKIMRRRFSVVMEKTIWELRGMSCLPLEFVQPRQQIMSSRSFGKPVYDLESLEEAVSHFTARACYKLRRQKSIAHGIEVYLQTNVFSEHQRRYVNALSFYFPFPVADNGYIISIAKLLTSKLYRKGCKYHKAGIMLLGISTEAVRQLDILANVQMIKREKLMTVVDKINNRMGEKTVFNAAQGINQKWQLKADYFSKRYTTRWAELALITSK